MAESKTFDPGRHLSLINGNEYLEVKWRLVWLRSEHPDARIETELVSHGGGEAIFRANVSIPEGGSATGWGSEDAQSFGDYIEKAETKAIGRALAALGFGTQFCTDFDFGAAQGRVVDSPVALRAVGGSDAGINRRRPSSDLAATGKQIDLIRSLGRDVKLDQRALGDLVQERVGRALNELSRQDASAVIDHLKELQQARVSQPA
jgi:hydrogenase maturation factor